MLHSLDWLIVTDLLGQPTNLTSRSQSVQEECQRRSAVLYWILDKCRPHVSRAVSPQSTPYANPFPSSPYSLPSPPCSTNPIHKHHVLWETITASIIPHAAARQTYPWNFFFIFLSMNSPTLAVAASKLDIYPMLCVQFLSSWWWAEKPPETRRALTVMKNIV